MLLVPQVIPASALGSGSLDMRLFLASSLNDRYAGAFTLRFDGIAGVRVNVDFMYSLDSQGFRIEHVPQTSLDGITVARRASSPLVIYFFKTERTDARPPVNFATPPSSPASPPMTQEYFTEPSSPWGSFNTEPDYFSDFDDDPSYSFDSAEDSGQGFLP